MEKINRPIILVTSILLIYTFLSGMEANLTLLMVLFLTLNAAFIWMVIRILKDGEPSTKSFDDYFYEDREDLKRNS